ncbi:hypothetical protein Tco_1267779, partial [Tanacetum coccineum]
MRDLYSSHIACFQLGSRRAWKGDLGIGEEVVTCKLYLGLAFTILTLERVTIGCCEVGGGGGGGGSGGVGAVCGDGVDRGLEVLIVELFVGLFVGLLFVVVFVDEKWVWDVIVDGGGGEDIKSQYGDLTERKDEFGGMLIFWNSMCVVVML